MPTDGPDLQFIDLHGAPAGLIFLCAGLCLPDSSVAIERNIDASTEVRGCARSPKVFTLRESP